MGGDIFNSHGANVVCRLPQPSLQPLDDIDHGRRSYPVAVTAHNLDAVPFDNYLPKCRHERIHNTTAKARVKGLEITPGGHL